MEKFTLEAICEFLNTTQGLDKLYRLLSYASKLLSALLVKGPLSESLSRLGRNLSLTRTVMRLVGLLHNLRTTLREFKGKKKGYLVGEWSDFKAMTRIITNYTYLPCDHLAWMGRESIYPFSNESISLFSRTSAQSWFIGLLVEIVDLWRNVRALLLKFNNNLSEGRLGLRGSLKVLKQDSRPIVAKAFLILGDFPLSINYSLRDPFMSPVMVGICGTMSSVAALYLRWASFSETKIKNDSSDPLETIKDIQ